MITCSRRYIEIKFCTVEKKSQRRVTEVSLADLEWLVLCFVLSFTLMCTVALIFFKEVLWASWSTNCGWLIHRGAYYKLLSDCTHVTEEVWMSGFRNFWFCSTQVRVNGGLSTAGSGAVRWAAHLCFFLCLFCCHIFPADFPDLLCVPQVAMFSLTYLPLLVMFSLLRICYSLIQ